MQKAKLKQRVDVIQLEQLVDELLKLEPREDFVRQGMKKLGIPYVPDRILQMEKVMELMNVSAGKKPTADKKKREAHA